MLVYADAHYRLDALGLQDDAAPLVLQSSCVHCGQCLRERIYDGVPDGPLAAVIQTQAAEDAAAVLAHRCLTP